MKRIITIAACSLYVVVLGGATDNYGPTERGYYDDNGSFHAYSKSHPPPPEAPAPPSPSPVKPRSQYMTQDSNAEPPARFNHRPGGRVIEEFQSLEQIQKTCASRIIIRSHPNFRGCASSRGGVCRVYIANGLTRPQIEHVRRHEYAHCNGWSSNHEP